MGTGVETISAVNLSSDYTQTSVTASINGDGMVLFGSATYFNSDEDDTVFSFVNVEHVDLVSNSAVLDQVIDLITFETGVTANVSQAAVDIAA